MKKLYYFLRDLYIVATNQAQRIAVPGLWRIYREGTSLKIEIF